MADLFKNIFCFCCRIRDEIDNPYDESSHLIPQTVEPPVIYSNVVLVDHKKLQERLGHIVRTKEGKMVNVASHIPFNLHNQVIPQEPHSISRSVSGSMGAREDQRHDPNNLYSDFYSNRDVEQQRQRPKFTTSGYPYGEGPPSRSPSVSSGLLAGPSYGTRPRSGLEQPKPTPILNVRLVGYTDTRARGRTRDRGSIPSGLPSSALGDSQTGEEGAGIMPLAAGQLETDESTPIEHATLMSTRDFKLTDTIPITVSWSD